MGSIPFEPSKDDFNGHRAGLAGRVLLGWMDRAQAVNFLTEECVFQSPLSCSGAEEIWEAKKAAVESLGSEEPPALRKLPLSEADLKAARKFRSKHPEAVAVVDFTRLNPMDLVVHQLWLSSAIAEKYRSAVTPDKWRQTALVDPPSNRDLKWTRQANLIVCDLPHAEYLLAGPLSADGQMKVVEAPGFVTVAFHAERALLVSGYHRTHACAEHILQTPNAPHGVLFGVANYLAEMGEEARDVLDLMEMRRPPRMADFFDERLALPVQLRRRRYRMQIRFDVIEATEEGTEVGAAQSPSPHPHQQQVATDDVKLLLEAAVRHEEQGKTDDLIATYRRIVFLRPDHSHAHNNLGVALGKQGKSEEALEHFQRALALDPHNAGTCNNIGKVFLALRRAEAAVEYFEKALAIDPRHALAHNNLGVLRRDRGDLVEALRHYDAAIASMPSFAQAHYHRTEIKTFSNGDCDLKAIEALVRRPDLSPDEEPFAHFALGKAYEDTGDYNRAVEHLLKANRLRRQRIAYNEANVLRRFHDISNVFTRDLMEHFEGFGCASQVPIFVVGMPRSGSTLVEQILSSHPLVDGAGEVPSLERVAGIGREGRNGAVPFPDYVSALNRTSLREFGETYIQGLPTPGVGVSRITDKMLANFSYVGLIRLILPNARIIHTRRDPVETCMSCFSKPFTVGHEYSYDLGEMGRYYRHYDGLMDHWRSLLPAGAMFEVRYEDVVNDLEGQARRLIEYCGLEWNDRCLAFHRNKRPVETASGIQVRQPIFRSSLRRWHRYEASIGPLLQELEAGVSDAAPVRAHAVGRL
jgi:tetratricopeptide (TPR) repeat protein